MISATLLLSTLALSALVNADVEPTEPGPNTVFKQGQTCRTVWNGDADGKWGNMAIELMTGSDLQMVHLTTVAENLDGNKDGQFEFECPEVDPYSAIYFFQYSAPEADGKQWATRFTITDKDSKSVPPPEDTQPNGKKIGWGIGKLVDASSAKPPPAFQAQASGTGGATNSTSTANSTASDTPTNTVSTQSGFTTAKPTTGLTGTGLTGTGGNASPTGGSGSSGSGSTGNSGKTNGNSTASNTNNNGTAGNNNGAVGVATSSVPLRVTFVVVAISGFASLFL